MIVLLVVASFLNGGPPDPPGGGPLGPPDPPGPPTGGPLRPWWLQSTWSSQTSWSSRTPGLSFVQPDISALNQSITGTNRSVIQLLAAPQPVNAQLQVQAQKNQAVKMVDTDAL